VIFFRNQALTPEQLKAFGSRFGSLFVHPNFLPTSDDPYVIDLKRGSDDKKVAGEKWHSDTDFVEEPPMGAILCGVDVPPYGGDTLFANQYLAYDALSPGLQAMLAGLRVEISDRKVAGPALKLNAARTTKVREDDAWRESVSFHPIVRTHPETQRKSLYVTRATAMSIENMTEEESKPLLDYLCEHAHRPEFTCRFRWSNGAVAFWDNRCTQHMALNDTTGFARHMRRVQIAGNRPR
jgi:taurine dioxygenase